MKTALNVPLLAQRAGEIREQTGKIRHYASLPDDEFMADERNLYTVLHLLLISIEATAAICNHILAKVARKVPESYVSCFEAMSDMGIVSEDLLSRLKRMARFRTLLVHRYWTVDPQKVLEIAREHTSDFEEFLQQVSRWLEEQI